MFNAVWQMSCFVLLWVVISSSPILRAVIGRTAWQLFISNAIINQTKILLPQGEMTLADFDYHVKAPLMTCSQKLLNYLAFQSFDYEGT
jgi:hypothetical protein